MSADWTFGAQCDEEREHLFEAAFRRLEAEGRPEMYTLDEEAAIIATLPRDMVLDEKRRLALNKRIVNCVLVYLFAEEIEKNKVDNAARRKQLQALERTARTLRNQIRELDPIAREGLAMRLNVDALYQWVDQLADASKWEREAGVAKPRKGPQISAARRLFMKGLVAVWEEFTGEQAGYWYSAYRTASHRYDTDLSYQGPFLDFAEAVARPIMKGCFRRRDFVEWIKKDRALKARS